MSSLLGEDGWAPRALMLGVSLQHDSKILYDQLALLCNGLQGDEVGLVALSCFRLGLELSLLFNPKLGLIGRLAPSDGMSLLCGRHTYHVRCVQIDRQLLPITSVRAPSYIVAGKRSTLKRSEVKIKLHIAFSASQELIALNRQVQSVASRTTIRVRTAEPG
jgi:hypothetical protein